jgi:four helix bundle protein
MAQPSVPKRAAGLAGFDAYQLAVQVYRGVLGVTRGRVQAERIDQLVRAADSVIRNIGEGHPTVGPDQARRFRIAANEVSECGASLDILEIRREIDPHALAELRATLDRLRAVLWRLSRPR